MAGVLLTPDMASATFPKGVVSGTSYYSSSYPPWYTMDRNTGNYWLSRASLPVWLKYDFGFEVTVQTVTIYFYSTYYRAIDYTFECSDVNDFAGEQEILYTKVGNTSGTVVFDIPVPRKARYYRLNVTRKNNSSYLVVKEWYLYGFGDPSSALSCSATVAPSTMKTFSSDDTSGSASIRIERTEEIENVGSGSAARIRGDYTRKVESSSIRMGDGAVIDMLFGLPTVSDWLVFETYDVNGIVGDVGETKWTDKIPDDITAYLVAAQDEVNSNVNITEYKCKAIRYHSYAANVDTYVGNETTIIAPEGTAIPFIVPTGNWGITKDIITPSAPVFDITTIEGVNTHQIEVIGAASQEVILLDTSTGTVVDTGTATSVTLTVPETGDIRTYQVYCSGDTSQVKFLGVAKHSSCNFARASSITTLNNLYADGTNVTSFSWNGECNATSAISAWTKCAIQNFPTIPMSLCTDFSSAWREFSGTFSGIPDTSAGLNFYRAFHLFSGTNIPGIDLRASTNVQGIVEGSSSIVDGFDTTGKTNFSDMFFGFNGTIVSVDTSSGTNFEYMFSTYAGATIPPLDLRSATTLANMFILCTSNYTSLDTAGITNFSYMFHQYDADYDSPLIDTSSGTNFNYMFAYANNGSIAGLDLRLATLHNNLLYQCTKQFLSINVSGRTSINHMFDYYYYTGAFPLIDTASCTNWEYAFWCSRCEFVTNGLDMSAATALYRALGYTTGALGDINLSGASSVNGILDGASGQILSLNTSGVTSFSGMFGYYKYAGDIPFMDTSSGTDFSSMFSSCTARLVHPMNTSSGISFRYMFSGWGGQAGSTMPDMDLRNSADLYGIFNGLSIALGALETTGVSNFHGLFRDYNGAEAPTIVTSSGTNYEEYLAFANCSFTTPYINAGANLAKMFYSYTGPTDISIDISNAGAVNGMFDNCYKQITTLTVTGKTSLNALFQNYKYTGSAPSMDTSACTNFGAMFAGSQVSAIPALDTSNGTSFVTMFNGFGNTALHIGLDFRKSIDSASAFNNCAATITHLHLEGSTGSVSYLFNSYTGESIPALDLNTVGSVSSMFSNTYAPFAGTVDVSQRTSCSIMFHYYYGPSFPHLDFTGLTEKITSSNGCIFRSATAAFTTVDLTGVTALDYIFHQYVGTSIPAINTDSGSTFNYFLSGCTNLVCITNVNTANSTSTLGMFDSSGALVNPDATARSEILAGSVWVNPGSCP